MRNYFKKDASFKPFFSRLTTWDYLVTDYGFTGEDKVEQAENLESLLDTISGFLPSPFLTIQITQQTKCMEDVWNLIWKYYRVVPSASTYLDLHSIHLEKDVQ